MPDRPTLPGPAGDRGTPGAAALGCADGRAERAVDGCLQAAAAGAMAWDGGGRRRWLRELSATGAPPAAPGHHPLLSSRNGSRRGRTAARRPPTRPESGGWGRRSEATPPRGSNEPSGAGLGLAGGSWWQEQAQVTVADPAGLQGLAERVGAELVHSASSRWTLRDQATRPDGGR
jgi:hypothetical protein